jgi:hypothetical protein
MKILNAFSINMLSAFPSDVRISEVSAEEAKRLLVPLESAVGHADTAAVIADVLGMPIPANRTTVSIGKGEEAVVAQYVGPRLPEGTARLPEGASIRFFLVSVS